MELLILSKIVLIFILLCLAAFFSGAQTALFSLGPVKLQQLKAVHQPRAALVQELLDKPRRLLISTLVGNVLITISVSVVTASLGFSLLGNQGIVSALVIMLPIILFFGEVLPRTLAVSCSEQFSLFAAQPLTIFMRAISPIRWVMNKLLSSVITTDTNLTMQDESILQEELLTEERVEENPPEESEIKEKREMIHKILDFSDTLVSAIMTPRSRMFTLPFDSDVAQLVRAVKENHFSRIPVYKQEKNAIIGVLYAKDLLTLTSGRNSLSTMSDSLIRPPYFVPHDKKIPDLLKEFQDKQIHLALVVNENGTVTGLVTMEDLLEELFGEIYDEFDLEVNTEGTD